jgi:hypothetical protein
VSEEYVVPAENADSVSVEYDKGDYPLWYEAHDGDEKMVLLSKASAEWLADDLDGEQDDESDVTVYELEDTFGDSIRVHVPDAAIGRLSDEAEDALGHGETTTERIQEFASEDSELTSEGSR